MQAERHSKFRGMETFVGKDQNGEEIFHYTEDEMLALLIQSGARGYRLDLISRVLMMTNREDFHRFMFECGFADPVSEEGAPKVDHEGVVLPHKLNGQIYQPDSSSYGQPWHPYSAYFLLGRDHPWEVRANHRIPRHVRVEEDFSGEQ